MWLIRDYFVKTIKYMKHNFKILPADVFQKLVHGNTFRNLETTNTLSFVKVIMEIKNELLILTRITGGAKKKKKKSNKKRLNSRQLSFPRLDDVTGPETEWHTFHHGAEFQIIIL